MTDVRIDEDTRAGDLAPFLVTWTLAGDLNAAVIGMALSEAQAALTASAEGGPADAAVETYKAALTRLGRNPNRYRISSDALIRRARKDGAPTILPLVDLNNVLSIRSGWPIGCYDLARIEGAIVFRQGREGEVMTTLGKGDMDVARLPLLADDAGPFGSTVSDSTRSRVTEETASPFFVMYGYGETDEVALLQLVNEVCARVGGLFVEPPRLIRV
jgi:DNA/RNA-binding domain of Phe-tRNA-synthetase-like protein